MLFKQLKSRSHRKNIFFVVYSIRAMYIDIVYIVRNHYRSLHDHKIDISLVFFIISFLQAWLA